ncbi:glycosyl hydrolase [Sphingobacterium shayense]|uniref:glycoside hydrolase family 127 protein n=1 Tax=Sphingobacterium shayense TaxID=626343 RepID=UPI001556D974|nr:glycoside hydrolase family 127 protein [Sphingobacterium shayense]NQD69738.1 glycosyl hydrolase [Sphingobacterium shayense]
MNNTNMALKNLFFILFCITTCSGSALFAQTTKKVDYFDIRDIRLLSSPFKHAQDVDLNYLLEMDADRLLAPFLRESELPLVRPSYGNWENTGLDGHIGGHYISALSYMYAATGDSRIKERLDYMLSGLERCQKANGNGYIGGVPGGEKIWEEIKNGRINASGFSLNEKWVPLYNIHKTYAGLRDAYLLTDNQSAKSMLVNMANWALALVEQLSDEQIQQMLESEHGGLNEIFADVAVITGNPAYINLAKKFSQRLILEPLLQHTDSLTGLHANTQIPKVLGFKRIADVDQNTEWANAASFFWENVVQQRTISIGGNSVSEHFNPIDDFSKMMYSVEGPETCNTYNMLRLTKMLYQTSPQGKYLDYYERSLYNHILSTQHPEHGGFVYFTQIRPSHYRVYSRPHTSMWCCVGSGMENHAKYGEMIYASNGSELYVNLFIPSTLNWKQKNVEIVQENKFPENPSTRITVNTEKPTSFALNIRRPSWIAGEPIVIVNGKSGSTDKSIGDYIRIERVWEKGDTIEIRFPMAINIEQLPDKSNFYSFLYGPIVLAARSGTDDLKGLQADDSRMGHVARGKQIPMANIPLLTAEPKNLTKLATPIPNKPLHFSLTNLYIGDKKIQMELEPFYGIHDSRYILYWPQATEVERIAIQKHLAESEREELRLNSRTVDRVVCGEQQPESDHFIKEDNSTAGVNGDIRWRQTKAWFSYRMKKNVDKAQLYVKFLTEPALQQTEIIVEGIIVGSLKGTNTDGVQSIIFNWPNNLSIKNEYEIKIQAKGGKPSHKILEVRLLDSSKTPI